MLAYDRWNKLKRRKQKKQTLGYRFTKTKLKQLLASVEIIENKYPLPAIVLPFQFCPNCGCEAVDWHDHRVEYPEVWIDYFCMRCGKQVGTQENGPYEHVLTTMYYENEADNAN